MTRADIKTLFNDGIFFMLKRREIMKKYGVNVTFDMYDIPWLPHGKGTRNYTLKNPEELIEYLWVKPNVSGINVDLFVDDGGSYKLHRHKLLLFARNGYDKSVSKFIPFSISEYPVVWDDNMKFYISDSDVTLIRCFIKINQNLIKALAKGRITQQEFVGNVIKVAQ